MSRQPQPPAAGDETAQEGERGGGDSVSVLSDLDSLDSFSATARHEGGANERSRSTTSARTVGPLQPPPVVRPAEIVSATAPWSHQSLEFNPQEEKEDGRSRATRNDGSQTPVRTNRLLPAATAAAAGASVSSSLHAPEHTIVFDSRLGARPNTASGHLFDRRTAVDPLLGELPVDSSPRWNNPEGTGGTANRQSVQQHAGTRYPVSLGLAPPRCPAAAAVVVASNDALDLSARSSIEIGNFSERVSHRLVQLPNTRSMSFGLGVRAPAAATRTTTTAFALTRNSSNSNSSGGRSWCHLRPRERNCNNTATTTVYTNTVSGGGGLPTVRLCVLPATLLQDAPDSSNDTMNTIDTSTRTATMASLQPKQLLDVEAGRSMVIAQSSRDHYCGATTDVAVAPLLVACRQVVPIAKQDADFFQERSDALQDVMGLGCMLDFETSSEVGILGGAWRGALRRLLLATFDPVNGVRLGRALQLSLFFQTGYECYVTSQVIEALDKGNKKDLEYILSVAFKNRNVSRALVQALGPRYDFLWHWSTAVVWNRQFDAWGQFPIVGITGFPASENFPSTRDHALASIFRVVLGQGNWITRVVTRGREGLITDNPKNTAQNLAAESNGFELANRNQYGTDFGREKTNEFRFAHRLPTDESLLRTFVVQPMPTMTNNGVVHVLRQLANHWSNTLSQEWGNFAHQRMEQLDPFETLRYHMPEVLVALSTLRGRNRWDSRVLGPMIEKLQDLKPAFHADAARKLVRELEEDIVLPVCGGIASLVDPFRLWLGAIGRSCDSIEVDARKVYEIVTSVEVGIRLGHDLITQISWKIPSDSELKKAIFNHICGESTGDISERRVRSALHLTTPRDKRTLMELFKNKLGRTKPALLLLGRVKTLLQRELRRDTLNGAIRTLSMGDYVYDDLVHAEWYWLEKKGEKAVYIYNERVSGSRHRFTHIESGFQKVISLTRDKVKIRTYVPVAEAISRAQKAFMTIELDHGKTFKYNAFMELMYLRIALRRLVVVSQMTCEELDNARLNLLREIQRSSQMQLAPEELVPGTTYYVSDPVTKAFSPFVFSKELGPGSSAWDELGRSKIVKVPGQSVITVGGGPAGLLMTIHCTENCLVSGGEMKLFEARDAFAKGGSTFERAQIVRLDARWISMLRYHLGTGFEDVYIPASGETDSQLGNTLPSQGFVEITIKDLENMLHTEVSRLWSKGVISVFTDSRAMYDHETNSLTKFGGNLKLDDLVRRQVNKESEICSEYHSWKVAELVYTKSLGIDNLKVGEEYGVFIRLEQAVLPFKLVAVDLDLKTYTFRSLSEGIDNLKVNAQSLPSVYPSGTSSNAHADVHKVVLESVMESTRGGVVREVLLMTAIKKEKFTLDVGHTHVVEAIGKPQGSRVHLLATTTEPYGVCCMQGLKVSLGMHNFGEKRWGSGIVDDLRSQNDQNTRIIGDFTKMVQSAPIAMRMFQTISRDADWACHFEQLVADSSFPELNEFVPVVPTIVEGCRWLAENAKTFRRQTLQTRFFETGDNYYLGMEFTREYDSWKNVLAEELVCPLKMKATTEGMKREVDKLKGLIMHHLDRLWYDGCLETIREGDVYNPGARKRIPRLYLINGYSETNVGSLPVGEGFRCSSSPEERYEILVKFRSEVVVRNVEGYVSRIPNSTPVKREGNLTRSPDGNQESKVALATFPVGHYVAYRTMRMSDKEKGYVFAFIGDEQATPHFMRYSGLTGACINAMSFNNFIKQAIDGVPFVDRFRTYSQETNWSNGEVVQRGTGANYGQDGFLRPGFSYRDGVDYLHSKVIEYRESAQNLNQILSYDWKVKIAASLIPRGMEMNRDFVLALKKQLQQTIFDKFLTEVKADNRLRSYSLSDLQRVHQVTFAGRRALKSGRGWDDFLTQLNADERTKKVFKHHVVIVMRLEVICKDVIEFAKNLYLYNRRISSELSNQSKSVDSVVDDFAVEAQNFANSLTMAAAFGSGALAFRLLDTDAANFISTLLGVLNILISFGTMTNVARYKIRNEEARIVFADNKLSKLKKSVFSLMEHKDQASVPASLNPFVDSLDEKAESFRKQATYYGYCEPKEFNVAYTRLKRHIQDADEIRVFQKMVTVFLVDTYHVNSYVQEALVELYKTTDDMRCLLTQPINVTLARGVTALGLFDRINKFEFRLEQSLQRGPVRWGFVKQRKFAHWDIVVALRYFYSLFFCSRARGSTWLAPIQSETLGILKQVRSLSEKHHWKTLRREARDLESQYWATRESDIASLIFLSGYFVFVSSIIFSVARLGSIDILEDFAFWATAASTLGAALATFHLLRKLYLLCGLWSVLGSKKQVSTLSEDRQSLQTIRAVTFTQILLTVARLATAVAAAVALPFSVAENGFGNRITTQADIPFWIALGAVVTAVASAIFFFVVEYVVRYNLTPQLGLFVCESFRDEIESIHQVLTVQLNEFDTKQVQEREAWEYTAREFLHKYRFDTVFAADRFGQILQYIQGGMDPRADFV